MRVFDQAWGGFSSPGFVAFSILACAAVRVPRRGHAALRLASSNRPRDNCSRAPGASGRPGSR